MVVVLLAAMLSFATLSATALADDGGKSKSAFVPPSLAKRAAAHPTETFNVIVRGRPGENSASVAKYFTEDGARGKVKRQFYSIDGAAGSLTGAELLKLAQNNHVFSITPDAKMGSTGIEEDTLWRTATNVLPLAGSLLSPAPQAPGIAVIDSGVDASKLADFGARVVKSVDFSTPDGSAKGDDEGHGTMVAGLAAGAGAYPGVARNAPIVSLRTSDAQGASHQSDVIAAIDWLLQNGAQYNVKVANLSMRSSNPSSFRTDPLDKAVEKLWLSGITVVVAVGNYGVNGQATQVQYSPGNDPFVISVGATDTNGTASTADDTIAPWSAWGHTLDGFSKPDISAPGRWIVAPVPAASTLATTAADRVVAPGYMWMSGTSLAAPMVAGAAAAVLARHPGWTPDQVKGALMKTATKTASGFAAGVGEVNAAKAAQLGTAPNPNSKLYDFVTTASDGTRSFDGTTWMNTLRSVTDWSATDWSATDWSATDWSATDWSATDWSATDWSATDWSATDWSATDWSATDWSE
jgi:serine protease AprX